MARYNEILVGRYNRYLQKLLALKGWPPSPQLSTDIGVSLNLFHGVETRYLEGWDRFAAGLNAPAVALNGSGVQLRNPLALNVVVVIESILLGFAQNSTWHVSNGATNVDLATPAAGTNRRLDVRSQRQLPSAILSTQNSVAGVVGDLLNIAMITGGLGSTSLQLVITNDQEITLLPGDALRVTDVIVNTQVFGSFTWRERFLEESERT